MVNSLDCDGVSPMIFHYLAKETRKLDTAHVFIPSTVVFDHGFASQWYYSTPLMEIKRRNERDISASEIWREFTQHMGEREDIVAVFYSRVVKKKGTSSPTASGAGADDDDEDSQTLTTYMGKQQLKNFLFSGGEKPTGVLQKFLYPKGWCSTSVVATWSPRVTIIEALRNPASLFDKTKSVAERGATQESPYATQVSVTNSVSTAVRLLCQQVVQHVYQTDHITMSGMMLHFKVDSTNRVVLLFSTSMRGKVEGSIFDDAVEPINLCHQLVSGETYLKRQKLQEFIDEKRRMASEGIIRRDGNGSPTSPPSSPHNTGITIATPSLIKSPGPSAAPSRSVSNVGPNRTVSSMEHSLPRSLSPIQASHQSTRTSSLYKSRAAEMGYVPPKGSKSTLVLPTVEGLAKFVGNRWVPLGKLDAKHLTKLSVDFKSADDLENEDGDSVNSTPFGEGDEAAQSPDCSVSHGKLTLNAHNAHRSPTHKRRSSRSVSPANAFLTPSTRRKSSRHSGSNSYDSADDDDIYVTTHFDSSDDEGDDKDEAARAAKEAMDAAVDFFEDLFYSLEQKAIEQMTTTFSTTLSVEFPAAKIGAKYLPLADVLKLTKEFSPKSLSADDDGDAEAETVTIEFALAGRTFNTSLAQGRTRSSIFLNKRRKELRRDNHQPNSHKR